MLRARRRIGVDEVVGVRAEAGEYDVARGHARDGLSLLRDAPFPEVGWHEAPPAEPLGPVELEVKTRPPVLEAEVVRRRDAGQEPA